MHIIHSWRPLTELIKSFSMKKLLIHLLALLSLTASAQSDITWLNGMNIAVTSFGNKHPRIALDRSGNPLVVWGRLSDQSVFFSRWNGTSFSTPLKVNPSWMQVATATWQGPQIASKGDTVYIVVKRWPEAYDTNHIYIFTSFNGGQSFKNPVELAIIGDSLSRFPTVETDADGQPMVAYMKFNPSMLETRWVVMKSSDFGASFSPAVKASGWGGSAEVCDCCPGALVCSGNNCAMLYRNNNANIRDSWLGLSTNKAGSFTTGWNIDNNNWMVMSCPSTGPDGIFIGDTLYSVFASGASGIFLSYLSKSSLSAASWVKTEGLTASIPGMNQQNFPRIASSGNAIGIVWKQIVNGSVHLPILFTSDISAGFPPAFDTVDVDDITNADIAISDGMVHVIWEDDISGTVKYRKGSYPVAPVAIPEKSQSAFEVFPNPVDGYLSITTPSGTPFSIEVINVKGEIIYSAECKQMTTEISTLSFPQGLYFVNLKSTGRNLTYRLIKQ